MSAAASAPSATGKPVSTPTFSLLTFNVLKGDYHSGPAVHDQWSHRNPKMVSIIERLTPSIVCL